jgi:hypothetical protein
MRKTFGGTNDTLIMQFGYINSGQPKEFPVFSFIDGTTTQCTLYDYNGTFKVYSDGNLRGTASSAHSMSTWHQVETKVTFSTGVFTLKVDGVSVLSLSGEDLTKTANNYADGLCFGVNGGEASGYSNGYYFGISDVILMDTSGSYCKDFLGSRMVEVKVPTGAGNYAQFTPSAGNNWSNVDEVPPDTSDYNTGDVNNIDSFTKAALLNPSSTIDAVVCSAYCQTNDGGSASYKGLVRSSSTDGLGTELSVPSSWGYLQSFIYVDPNTSSPFTASALDSAEIGYKRTA